MARIYISSTFDDLKDYRAAAYRTLRQMQHDVVSMEDYTAGDQRPLDKCLADVAACEVYVGIFAWRYGFIPEKDNPERKSITELEYRKASQEGKPRLIFLLHPNAEWKLAWTDMRTGEGGQGKRIDALRGELGREHTVSFFNSPDALSGQISVALQQALVETGMAERRRALAEESELRRSRVRQRVVGLHSDIGEHFKGRLDEQKLLGSCLAEPSTRLVSILGRPGIGKTALATRVLGELQHNRWPHEKSTDTVDGILYLSTRTSGGVSLESLFISCGTMLGGDREDALQRVWANSQLTVTAKVERLLTALEGGLYVVLMDHMEDLLDDEGVIADPDLRAFFEISLSGSHGARLLVTSRSPITFHPDWMGFDKRIPLVAGLSEAEGIAMLRDMDPNGTWGIRDMPEEQLARAVRRTYGIPDSLKKLAGLLKKEPFSSPDELLDKFQNDVVGGLMKEAYLRLEDNERRVMEALATFGRPVPLIAVQFMAAGFQPGLSVDAVLRRLIDIHMVMLDRPSQTVSLNPIDQDYVLHQLSDKGNQALNALDNRAAEYYAQLRVPRDRWQSAVDLGPYLLEFEHRFRAGEYESAAEVLNQIDVEFAAWRTHTRRLQALYQRLEGKLADRRLQMLQIYSLGQTYIFLGPLEKAAESFERARSIAREIGDREAERKATAWIGEAARRLGQLEKAIENLGHAVAMMPPDTAVEDTFLLNLGLAHAYRREFRLALKYGGQLMDLGETHSDPVLTAEAHDVLSLANIGLSNFEEALKHARRSAELYRTADARDPLAYVRNVEAMACIGAGKIEEGIQILEEVRQRGNEDDTPRLEGFSLFNLARVYRMKGTGARALEIADAAAAVLGRIGAPETAAASAFANVLRAEAANDGKALARALLSCAGGCNGAGDLFSPEDLLREAETIARAEGLEKIAQEAHAALKDFARATSAE
jgi:tetratricopeptide (TPR) repeat protein